MLLYRKFLTNSKVMIYMSIVRGITWIIVFVQRYNLRQLSGYVDVIKEQVIISVRGSIIISRVSLQHCTLTLSGPGALWDGDLKIILRTSSRVIKINLNLSTSDTCVDFGDGNVIKILFWSASSLTLSAVLSPLRWRDYYIPQLLIQGPYCSWVL